MIRRYLRFQAFKIQMRDHILATLNSALRIAGHRIGFNAQIKLNGVCSTGDVEQATQMLNSGACKFSEIIDPFLRS